MFRLPIGKSMQNFANQIDADFIDRVICRSDRIEVWAGGRKIHIEICVTPTGRLVSRYTRIKALFPNSDGFRLGVHNKDFFRLLDRFFLKTIPTGSTDIDRKFIILGNDQKKITDIFQHEKIRYLLLIQPTLNLVITPKKQRDRDNLGIIKFAEPGILSPQRIRAVAQLFVETLECIAPGTGVK